MSPTPVSASTPSITSAKRRRKTLRSRADFSTHCEQCERWPERRCAACAVRRTHAVRLVEECGLSVPDAAARLRLPVPRVERLLEEEADRRDLKAYVLDEVSNAPLRALVAEEQRADPLLTLAELARRVESSQPQVERWLGLRETTPKKTRAGQLYPPRVAERLSVDVAGRLARAIGLAPCELEGC